MSAFLFDILALQSAYVQAHANRHTFKVSAHTTHLIPYNYSVLPLALDTSALSSSQCILLCISNGNLRAQVLGGAAEWPFNSRAVTGTSIPHILVHFHLSAV